MQDPIEVAPATQASTVSVPAVVQDPKRPYPRLGDDKIVLLAFIAAQKEFAPAVKNRQNTHFNNVYADLDSVLEAVRPGLSSNGFGLTQVVEIIGNIATVKTILLHESGAVVQVADISLPASKLDPQGLKGATTYARRMGIDAGLGLQTADDDGNAASGIPAGSADAIDDDALTGLLGDISTASRATLLKTMEAAKAKVRKDKVATAKIVAAYEVRRKAIQAEIDAAKPQKK